MTQITVPSGADVQINIAPWQEAKILKQVFAREAAFALHTYGVTLSLALIMQSSRELEAQLDKCLARCLYNGQKIVDSTFDTPEARADLIDIQIACLKENLLPLAGSLRLWLLEFGILQPTPANEGQKPESTTKLDSSPVS